MKKENATSNQEHAWGTVMMCHDEELTPKESASHLPHTYSNSELARVFSRDLHRIQIFHKVLQIEIAL